MILSDAHRQHLYTSGLTDETIAMARIQTVDDPEELARLARWKAWPGKLGSAITFPVFVPGRRDALFMRLRPDRPHGAQKYINPKNTPVHPYFGPRTLLEGRLNNPSIPIVFTEGEKKTLALDQMGYAAVGATGVDCFHDTAWKKASGEWILHPSIRENTAFDNSRRILIAYDSDAEQKPQVMEAAQKLAWLLKQCGAAETSFVRIPVEDDEKYGIDDYFHKFGEEATREIIESAVPLSPLRPKKSNKKAVGTLDRLPEPGEQLTDIGNAERLVERHGQNIRYCAQIGGWHVWRNTHWAVDETGEIFRLAKDTIRQMIRVAADLPSDMKDALLDHARRSESRARVEAMVALAQNEAPVRVLPDVWDADKWLLSCDNGTIDLRTGKLRPHRRQDMITRTSSTAFVEGARSDVWDNFLLEATEGDLERISFLQRAVGYTLTGDTSEDKFFFIYGVTGSGKSTFLSAISSVLGDHAAWADASTFLDGGRDNGGARPELVRLVGRRMVACSEIKKGERLNESLVKTITGGDEVIVRDLYKGAFAFRPKFKLWLAANDPPIARSDDDAIWRRIIRVPFDRRAPNPDAGLRTRLQSDPAVRSAILAWAVEGALLWQKEGLWVPESVQKSTEAYRDEMDPLSDFIDFYCVFDEDARVSRRKLRREYETWAKGSGAKALGSRRFTDSIRKRILAEMGPSWTDEDTETRVMEGNFPERGWRGVRISTRAERAAKEAWSENQHDDLSSEEQIVRSYDYHETRDDWEM